MTRLIQDHLETLKLLRSQIVKTAFQAREGHLASAFSVLEILFALHLTIPIKNFESNGNRFILSKGHASLAYYVVQNFFSVLPREVLNNYCRFPTGQIGGHPVRNPDLDILFTTGSLGHGLPLAIGCALGKKIKGESGIVYCLIGDGELNEGSCWESLLLAQKFNLSNLVVIIDNNSSSNRAINLGSIKLKLEAFQFKVIEIEGHDLNALIHFFSNIKPFGPTCLLAQTTKGFGSEIIMNDPSWHHKTPNAIELDSILESLQI